MAYETPDRTVLALMISHPKKQSVAARRDRAGGHNDFGLGAEDRLALLRDLNRRATELTDEGGLQPLLEALLLESKRELAFGALYELVGAHARPELRAAVGLSPEQAALLGNGLARDLRNQIIDPAPKLVAGPEPLVVMPLRPPGESRPTSLFLAGPTLELELKDPRVQAFLELMAAGLSAAFATLSARAEQRRRAEFEQMMGIVSHDLRNPLHAIRLSASLGMRDVPVESRLGRTFERITASANRAVRMITDLLDFTSARRGRGIPIEPREGDDLHLQVSRAVEEVLVTRPERQVVLETAGDCVGCWDPDRISQVVQNLVGNALQHTVEGTPVSVWTGREGDWVILEVRNGGTPIPASELPFLFEPFRRGVRARSGGGRSLGLGLYITRQIVEAHGGSVQVSSNETQGTKFTVRLPCKTG